MLTPSQTVTLVATTKDATGTLLTGRTITWSTTAANVATVDGTGLVTAIAVGTALVTATSEGQNASATISVAAAVVPVATVTLNQTSASLVSGQTATLVATTKDVSGNVLTGRGVTWNSTVSGVASVDGNGVVTPVAPGTTTITATSEGKSASATVTVNSGAFLGPAGGTATGFGGGATVTIPAGALSSALAITITQVTNPQADPKLAPGTVYDFGPTGTAFAAPVTLAIKYDPTSLAVGTNQAQLRVHKLVGTAWTPLAGSSVNTATHVVSGATSSFSTYGVLEVAGTATITGVSPILALAGGVAFTATVTGTNFPANAVVQWNGQSRATIFVSATQLTTQVSAADIAVAGTALVSVQVPGAGTTATQSITILGAAQTVAAAADDHSCAISTSSAMYCWGDNRFQQVGDNSAPQVRATAVAVGPGLSFSSIAVGDGGSCGLGAAGAIYCWSGGYGDPVVNYVTTHIPVHVAGGMTFASVSRGANNVCGITTTAQAYCWGVNGNGQNGDGTTATTATPGLVLGGRTFVLISAGTDESCGLDATGAAWCWGMNSSGQLGHGDLVDSHVPVAVAGGQTFVAISAGNPSCGITRTGAAYCWGDNSAGALGNGTMANSSVPVAVSGGLVFSAISAHVAAYTNAGSGYVCGITMSGAAYCWGPNFLGSLGTGQESASSVPTPVAGGVIFSAISTGSTHACGIAMTGGAYCWGQRGFGFLGDGFIGYRNSPTAVVGGLLFTTLSIGTTHICGLVAAGDVWCWGDGSNGQLGNGTDVSSPAPVEVSGNHHFNVLSVSSTQVTCGVATDTAPPFTKTYCWGNNVSGALGHGTAEASDNVPVAISGNLSFATLSSGALNPGLVGTTTCGATTAGVGYCWGYNGTGQIGDGTQVSQSTPTLISGGVTWRSFSVGGEHTCGLAAAGDTEYCWGGNDGGQLGLGVYGGGFRLVPMRSFAGEPFTSVAAGFASTCTVTSVRNSYCWGNMAPTGGGVSSSFYPIQILGTQFTSIQLGGSFGCGLATTFTATCWGFGREGELGNGAFVTAFGAQDLTSVIGGPPFQSIYVGGSAACGLSAGQAYCWGDNSFGTLGIGETDHVNQPTPISSGGASFKLVSRSISGAMKSAHH